MGGALVEVSSDPFAKLFSPTTWTTRVLGKRTFAR
jgi:hypothetical protein